MARKIFVVGIILAVTVSFLLSGTAYAGNGTRMLGFSTRDSAMAGATTASSEDTACLVRNPAGLVNVGNRIDVEYQNILPHDVKMHTEGPGIAAVPFFGNPMANVGLRQKSTIEYLPGGNIGFSYRIPRTERHPVVIGVGVFTMAGVAVNYPSSRINSMYTGDYDKMVDLRSMRIAPGIAVGLTDQISVGATANFAIQGLRANLATSTFNAGSWTFPETDGGGKWDFTPGGGFTVGLQYKLNDMFCVGTSYESRTWMARHYQYKDCLPYIDEPPVINVGLSFKPVKELELTFDTRYISWTDVKIARATPANGGFGWRDQWVFAVAGEYSMLKDKLKLRLGYNYGKSPIQEQVIFANALLPLIVEHHLTTGFSYALTKNLSVDLTWEHHFYNSMTDSGLGDVYSQNGKGTTVTAAAEVISIGAGYKF